MVKISSVNFDAIFCRIAFPVLLLTATGATLPLASMPTQATDDIKLETDFLESLPGHTNSTQTATARGSSSAIRHGRLSFRLPGQWQSRRKGSSLVAVRNDRPGQQLIIAEPSAVRTWTASAYLAHGIKGLESKSGWQVLKAMPQKIGKGFTRNGHGFAFQARITHNRQNQNQYVAYYAISTGNRFQTIIAMATDSNSFRGLIREMGFALDKVQVNLPRAQVVPGRGKNFDYFNYKAIAPNGGKLIQGPYSNMIVWRMNRLPGSNYKFGNTNRFIVEFELQPSVPISPLKALESYLTGRSTLHRITYKSGRLKKHNPRIVATSEGRLPNGLTYTGLALQQTPDDRFYLGAYLVQSSNSSVIIASGFKLFKYDLIKRNSSAAKENRAWYNFYNKNLLAHAATIKFDNNQVKRDKNTEIWLIRKKQFRYHNERSVSSGSISLFTGKKSFWDFQPGNKVSYNNDNFSALNTSAFNQNTGRTDSSSGYLTGGSSSKNSSFQVWSGPHHNRFIIVQHPSGIATFHITTTGSQFTIDGKRHGCCR